MDSNHSLHVDRGDAHGDEVKLVVSRLDQVLATLVPLVLGFSLLQSDVTPCLQFSDQLSNRDLTDLQQPLLHSVINLFHMEQLLDSQAISLLDLGSVPFGISKLHMNVLQILIQRVDLDVSCLLHQL